MGALAVASSDGGTKFEGRLIIISDFVFEGELCFESRLTNL